MPARRQSTLFSILGLLTAFTASAIVIRHDRPDAAYRELAVEYPFCSLNLGGWGGGCTLIDPHWVITAAHAAGRIEPGARIEVGGQSVEVAEVIAHPDFNTRNYRNDLALLRLAEPILGQTPVALYQGRDEVGQRVVFVGRGYSGTGESGAKTRDKVRRAAENRVEDVTDHWLKFIFDAPPDALELEGISGPGDSGGPAFLETGGEWVLMGISSWQDNTVQGAEGVYGVKEFYVRVSSFVEWIEQTMDSNKRVWASASSGATPAAVVTSRNVRSHTPKAPDIEGLRP